MDLSLIVAKTLLHISLTYDKSYVWICYYKLLTQSIKDIECRLPYWETVARDKERFKNKILEHEIMLSPIILNHMEKNIG
jgi:hypothetical protein